MFKAIDHHISVSPQIGLEHLIHAQTMGITTVINNRPDDEEPGQPSGAEIEAAVKSYGMTYVAIPVTHSGFSGAQVDAMLAALDAASGPVLAYCRSGTRSTMLWALARAKAGDSAHLITEKAAEAGYDVSPIRALIDALAAAQ